MKTVWKFTINDEGWVELPPKSRALHVARQGQKLCCWAEVDTELAANFTPGRQPGVLNNGATHWVRIFGTGHPMEHSEHHNPRYLNTFFLDALVFHAYELEL